MCARKSARELLRVYIGGYVEEAVFGPRLKMQDEGPPLQEKESSRAGSEGLFAIEGKHVTWTKIRIRAKNHVK